MHVKITASHVPISSLYRYRMQQHLPGEAEVIPAVSGGVEVVTTVPGGVEVVVAVPGVTAVVTTVSEGHRS